MILLYHLYRDPVNHYIYKKYDPIQWGLRYRVYSDYIWLNWVIDTNLAIEIIQELLIEGKIQRDLNIVEQQIQRALGINNMERFFLNV